MQNQKDKVCSDSIFKPGHNCWKLSTADRATILIDAKDYFKAVYHSISNSKNLVIILAWDIDSRISLLRGEDAKGRHPVQLGPFLDHQTKVQESLDVYILDWDYVQLFARSREILPELKFKLQTSPKVHFELDDVLPKGACHHQKVVIVDEKIAFCGGLDLTRGRWDTSEHLPEHKDRKDNKGNPYRAYHDMSILLEGEVAKEMSALARERWNASCDKAIKRIDSENNTNSPWPEYIDPMFRDIEVAITRTWVTEKERIQESMQMTIDLLDSAEDIVYIENQYLTARPVAEALSSLLEREKPPEIVIIVTPHSDGWLSQHTMDVLRSKLIRKLREKDHKNKLGVYVPHVPKMHELGINIHAKMMVVDNRYIKIGSTNLSNRSMFLDSECDVVLKASTEEHSDRIQQFRNERLGEFYHKSANEIVSEIKKHSNIHSFIDNQQSDNTRCLHNIDRVLISPNQDELVPADICDPYEPVDFNHLAKSLLVAKKPMANFLKKTIGYIVLFIVLGLVGLSQFTSFGDFISVSDLEQYLGNIRSHPGSYLWSYIIASLGLSLFVPITVFVVAITLVYDFWIAFAISSAAALTSSVLSFVIGHYLGVHALRKIVGNRVNRISKALGKHGILSSIAMRIVPVAPFAALNLIAGASHIKFRDFFWGTLIGQIPGILLITLSVDRVYLSIQNPDLKVLISSACIIFGIVFLFIIMKRYIKSKLSDYSIKQSDD